MSLRLSLDIERRVRNKERRLDLWGPPRPRMPYNPRVAARRSGRRPVARDFVPDSDRISSLRWFDLGGGRLRDTPHPRRPIRDLWWGPVWMLA